MPVTRRMQSKAAPTEVPVPHFGQHLPVRPGATTTREREPSLGRRADPSRQGNLHFPEKLPITDISNACHNDCKASREPKWTLLLAAAAPVHKGTREL